MNRPLRRSASLLMLLALADARPLLARSEVRATEQASAVPEVELRLIGAALRSARADPLAATGPLVEAILRSGPAAVDATVTVLVAAMVPRTHPDDEPQALSAPQRGILLEAVARMPPAEIRAQIGERLRAAPDVDTRVDLAAVHALGVIGNRHDLQPMTKLAPRKPGDRSVLTRDGRDALRNAVRGILDRDAGAWMDIAYVIRRSDRAAAQALLEAVGAEPDPRGLPVLADSAHSHPELAALCVGVATRVGPAQDVDATAEFVAWLVGEVAGARAQYRCGLLRAIGALDDGAHAADLIEALDDDDKSVRASAAWALKTLTGFGFGANPAPWNAWLATETAWNEVDRPVRREDLTGEDAVRAASAVRAYRGRRVAREALGEELVPVLAREEIALQILACDVLADLRARAAIPALAGLLDATDDGVREAARRSLAAICGRSIPSDPEEAAALFGLR